MRNAECVIMVGWSGKDYRGNFGSFNETGVIYHANVSIKVNYKNNNPVGDLIGFENL